MSFPGVVSDQPACVVAAESATANHAFIDHAFVLKQGLREYGTSGSVSAAVVCPSILVTYPLCLSLCTGCPARQRQRLSDSWLT